VINISWEIARKKMLINLMKKNRWEIGKLGFWRIFEIRSKDGSTFFVVFQKIKIFEKPEKYRQKTIKF
jgi:hypothetical protein